MKQKIGEIVEKALEEVNEDADERVDYAKETKLFGKGGGLGYTVSHQRRENGFSDRQHECHCAFH